MPKTQIGTNNIVKKMWGTSEIVKEVVNGVVVYEKSSSVIPWSCTVNNLGSQDPTNVSFTHNGTMPTFNEITIGTDVFIKIPTMYRKVNSVVDFQITSFTIANTQIDNTYQPYSCFIDENNNLLDYILIGKYWISSTTTANSVNATNVSMTIGNGRTLCQAKGTGYLLYDWQIHKLWQDLIICAKQTIDTNAGTAWTTDELGIYWGTFGCLIDGLVYNNGSVVFSYQPSKYIDSPTSSSDSYDVASYTMPTSTSNRNITKLGYDANHPFVNMPNTASGTSYTTYYCDQYYSGTTNNRPFYAGVGGAGASQGAFRSDFNNAWTYAYACRLCYRPIQ